MGPSNSGSFILYNCSIIRLQNLHSYFSRSELNLALFTLLLQKASLLPSGANVDWPYVITGMTLKCKV